MSYKERLAILITTSRSWYTENTNPQLNLKRCAMQLDRGWSFEDALHNINLRHPPYGLVGPQLRNRQIEAWGQLVGRTRALALFDQAVARYGSITALGREYHITVPTLRQLRSYYENLPDDLLDRERRIIAGLQRLGQESETIDAKRELILREEGDKAEFVKDVVAMANNGRPSCLIIGLEDGTFAPVGRLAHHYNTNDINQILAGRIDPPVVVEYREIIIDGNEYALLDINGTNRPYIVARDVVHAQADRKRVRVYKGTIFVRHGDRTEGISRAELEEIYKARN
mgnify:CR=1 FL=1